ncbi:biotin/lipoate--protein ligase family protein [Falsiroseomonas oryzae]|uniref:biotin/lipoate--protein ligase family protein n=1 Tax=Falsiroseomonas oryzae TaxID=2766473 RepID=UPI0022EB1899|nr:biotin/lipoate--protein ligase family protein [Roseomonas sp. MO-31]
MSSAASSLLPELPSVFTPVVPLREAGDALARAVALAPQHGAGTLAWVRSAARIEAAVVLEPEQPLAAARPALYAAASALADALAAFGPPEVPLTFRWPGRVAVNGGEVGGVRIAWPEGCAEDAVPDWIAVAVEARLMFPQGWEPGHGLAQTSLQEEGWDLEEATAAELTAAWARHLMANLAEWQRADATGGFRRLAERYLARLEDDARMAGGKRGLDPATGDLVVDRGGARDRFALAEALGA